MSKKHVGSSLDDFLKEQGTFEETQALAIKEVVVWQLTDAMEKQSLSKAKLAIMLKTSRSQVDRLLDPTRDVTLSTLQRAAAKFRLSWCEPLWPDTHLRSIDKKLRSR